VAPSKLALDTSAYSHLRVGHEEVMELVARAAIVSLPATVLGELEAGFLLGSRYRENSIALAEFLAEPFVRVLPVTPSVATRYGRAFSQLRRAGTPIPVNDIWIAAATLDAGAHLITFDADFGRVPGLEHTLLKG